MIVVEILEYEKLFHSEDQQSGHREDMIDLDHLRLKMIKENFK